jgi:hypothetical protein
MCEFDTITEDDEIDKTAQEICEALKDNLDTKNIYKSSDDD